MWHYKIQISRKYGKPVPKPAKTTGVSAGFSPVSLTQRFFRAHPPTRGSKNVTFTHKITISANNTDGIGTGYRSQDKEICLH